MEIKKRGLSKRLKILVALLVLLLICAGVYFVYAYTLHGNNAPKQRSVNSTNYGPATEEQKKAGATTKQNSDSGKQLGGSEQPPAPTPIPGSSQRSVSMTITTANQNGSTFQARVLIGAVINSGICTATFSKTGQTTVIKTAGVQPFANSSTCQGFDIPVSELSSGIWNLTISYSGSDYTGTVSKNITIE